MMINLLKRVINVLIISFFISNLNVVYAEQSLKNLQKKFDAITSNSQFMNKQKFKLNKDGRCPKLETAIIKSINEEREKENIKNDNENLKKLRLKKKLKLSARMRSKEMYEYDQFSHTRPNGSDWDTIFDEKQCKIENKIRLTEIIQFGITKQMPTPQKIFNEFEKSKTHYKNILGSYKYIGVGVYCQKVDGYYVWFVTVHFAYFN